MSKLTKLFRETFPDGNPKKPTIVLNTANDKLAHPEVPLHPASPLITAAKELNLLVNGAVPDYKSTAIALAAAVLDKHGHLDFALKANEITNKAHSDQVKSVMVLAGVVSSLRPVVLAIRNNPFLWAFVPKDLKRGVELVLHLQLPAVDKADYRADRPIMNDAFGFKQPAQDIGDAKLAGQLVRTDSKFRPL